MTDSSEIDMEANERVNAVLAEGERKAALVLALCDALVGSLPDKSSRVLQDVVQHLGRRLFMAQYMERLSA